MSKIPGSNALAYYRNYNRGNVQLRNGGHFLKYRNVNCRHDTIRTMMGQRINRISKSKWRANKKTRFNDQAFIKAWKAATNKYVD